MDPKAMQIAAQPVDPAATLGCQPLEFPIILDPGVSFTYYCIISIPRGVMLSYRKYVIKAAENIFILVRDK